MRFLTLDRRPLDSEDAAEPESRESVEKSEDRRWVDRFFSPTPNISTDVAAREEVRRKTVGVSEGVAGLCVKLRGGEM